ncbi:MAG: ABC transporter ATP-binding protein [Acidobacteriota bacterium]
MADAPSSAARDFLSIRGVSKRFGETVVLDGLHLDVAEGEILALLGLSGSGKTTALRILAGFETPDRGSVEVGGDDVTHLEARRRGFGMVFQHYALFPHLTVRDNVAFGLEGSARSRVEIDRRVGEMLELVDLAGFEARRPTEISGGQQQRVALARALAPSPRLLLLDEPLSNLDPSLRERTRDELRRAVRDVGITTVLVTHEQEEAFHVGDRVAVLDAGRLQQVGTAEDLYRRPATRFVAGFVGRSSALRGEVVSWRNGVATVRLDALAPAAAGDPSATWSGASDEPLTPGTAVELITRPEALQLATERDPIRADALPGYLVELRFTGPTTYGIVELRDGARCQVAWTAGDPADKGDAVAVRPAAPRADVPAPRAFPRAEAAGGRSRRSEPA